MASSEPQKRIGRRALAVAIASLGFALLNLQVAVAGTGDTARKASHGKKHAKASKSQLGELKQLVEAQAAALQAQSAELQSLRNQLGALQGLSGAPAVPTGAAGGDLTGTYPNPTIAANALGSAEVTDGSLLPADFNPLNVDGAAGTPSLRTLGAGAQQATAGNDPRLSDARTPTGAAGGDLTGTYPNPSIGAGQVRADELGSTIVRTSTLQTATDGVNTTTDHSCNAGERLLSGGVEINGLGSAASDVAVLRDSPIGTTTWRVSIANNPGGVGDFSFRVQVLCLQA